MDNPYDKARTDSKSKILENGRLDGETVPNFDKVYAKGKSSKVFFSYGEFGTGNTVTKIQKKNDHSGRI